MESPVVSFLSPCYNHSAYILESLNSIKGQTYDNIKHIIIDDCSKDDSVYKIQQWIDDNEYDCTFIKHQVNKGISYTFNEFLEMADGKYISALATDDYIMPERTAKFVAYLEQHPEDQMVVSDCIPVNHQSEIITDQPSALKTYTANREDEPLLPENFGTYQSLLKGNYIPSSILIRKSIMDKVGGFNPKLKVEDWDMWLRIARERKIALYPEPLTYYRLHDTNSMNNHEMMSKGLLQTFLAQKEFCNTSDLRAVYNKAFAYWFLHHYSGKNTESDKLFHEHAPKMLLYNYLLRMKFRGFIKKMLRMKS